MKNQYYKFLGILLIGLISVIVIRIVSAVNHVEYVANLEVELPVITSTSAATTVNESTTTTCTTTVQTSTTTGEIITITDTTTSTIAAVSTEATVTHVESTTVCTAEEPVQQSSDGVYLGSYEATWYCAVDMGYTSQPYGSSGRSLESGYSIASNSIPAGTLVKIYGGGLDGIYRVDDCGGMANDVIDFYYWDRTCIPQDFLNAGRISVEVYLVE